MTPLPRQIQCFTFRKRAPFSDCTFVRQEHLHPLVVASEVQAHRHLASLEAEPQRRFLLSPRRLVSWLLSPKIPRRRAFAEVSIRMRRLVGPRLRRLGRLLRSARPSTSPTTTALLLPTIAVSFLWASTDRRSILLRQMGR